MSQHCPAHHSRRTGNDLRDHESEMEKEFPCQRNDNIHKALMYAEE
jgi:hypothetical protein